jgi:exopolysaccharide biosynthesis polyprenyl glycosylphosphotransferase
MNANPGHVLPGDLEPQPWRASPPRRVSADGLRVDGDRVPVPLVAARHRPRDSAIRRLLALSDLAALALSQGLVIALADDAGAAHLLVAALALPLWVVVFTAYGLYDRDFKRISHTTVDDLPWVVHGVLVGTLLMYLWFLAAPVPDLQAAELLPMAAISLAAVPTLRCATRRAVRRVLGAERVLLVGDPRHVELISRKMRAHPEYRLEPIGVLGDSDTRAEPPGLPQLGRFVPEDLRTVLTTHRIDRVVVSHVDVDEERLLQLVRRCRELGVKVSVLPQLFDALGPSVEVDDVEGVTVLGITPPVLPRSSRMLKRAMDIAGAGIMLLFSAPLVAPIALAVKLDSRGPVFFRQERVGRRGKRFKVVKFRTMTVDAEQREGELAKLSRDPNWLLLDHDPRITRVGRFLRHSSLDELPQLWNVLRGQMSLVGPRPILPSHVERLDGWRLSRAELTPGLTGLWQVLGRTNIPFEEMIKLDYLYVTNWSLWTDIRLMLRTLPAVVARRGVN